MEVVIARAATGDADALGELWRAHNHLILRYFRAKGMAEPDDLASAVWIEVARNLSSFSGSADDFRRWLFTIASRRRIDEIRRDQRRRSRDEIVMSQHDDLSAPAAEAEVERSAALDRAVELVGTLPPDQSEAVLLRVVGDLSIADVAEIMECTEGNVRVLVHRGLKRLGERLAPPAGDADAVTNRPARTIYAT